MLLIVGFMSDWPDLIKMIKPSSVMKSIEELNYFLNILLKVELKATGFIMNFFLILLPCRLVNSD